MREPIRPAIDEYENGGNSPAPFAPDDRAADSP
jgi:hypothetical protein